MTKKENDKKNLEKNDKGINKSLSFLEKSTFGILIPKCKFGISKIM
jgi:hypothetical protein